MQQINREVRTAFRADLLNPAVLERALRKLQGRLAAQPKAMADRSAALAADLERLDSELSQLSAALAQGAAFASVLDAIRDRERQRSAIAAELSALDLDSSRDLDAFADVLPEARRRLTHWRAVLAEESGQARQMLRTLLDGRIVFSPRPDVPGVEFSGHADYGRLFAGLIGSQALASPTGVAPFMRGNVDRRSA